MLNKRWVQIGLLALALFAVNALARLVTRLGEFAELADLNTIGLIASSAAGLLLVGAGAWWSIRFPFGRMVADIGAAALVGALFSLLVGPFIGGSTPFAEGLALFVGQFLMFLGLGAIGAMLGFAIVVAFGKDWKSRGLRRYEDTYKRRPHRTVRG